ncbi:uncharacterized protein HKW66_Vig0116090 [Vigna angularis]|uniref:Uncharacterized protein n=2 Tax=Phaseolus angularis TaxID=3914 RepID=A0A8T0KXJ4_PHAAN|nr:uncharacterized protein LOC128195439 [Vigna angularis]KAG2404687.1 uncharacterized protein HKW66_Vig0116090 [Vigna angularis]BAT84141.1 hypothetical protein VIGAN_04142300 [Vigna angularis var. angularis]
MMEDSISGGHHNERKRSSDSNAFAKFLPFSPPLEDDPESHEAKFGDHHDHGHKRFKPNSQAPFLKTTTTDLTPSSHLPKQNIDTKETLDFSSPSTSIRHSTTGGPSPQSIGSKSSLTEYVENDGKICRTVSDSCNGKEDKNQSELETVMSMATEELSRRPRTGGIYKAIASQRECTVKRLKDLSNKEITIDVGLEMGDGAHLLKLMSFSSSEIEMAGQKGRKGAMLLIQAEILRKKGQELIAECQNLLQDAL